MQDSWPSAEHEAERASPLPRVEDLPYVERGYDPERVREAFDAFYRHLARLDATLRTIEAVDVFRDQADELRKELRALRTAGWTQQPWLPSYATRESARPGVPEAVFRWALEAAFVIAVPVAASVADLRSLWIVVAAAGAFVIVAITEWAASREREILPASLPAPAAPPAPLEEPEPVAVLPPVEPASGEATEWTLPPPAEEPEEEAQQEELTVVGAAEAAEVVQPELVEPEPELLEPEPVVGAVVERVVEPELLEPEPEPVAEAVVERAVEPELLEPEPELLEPEPEPVTEAVVEPAAEQELLEPELKPVAEAMIEPAAEPELLEPEPVVEAAVEPAAEPAAVEPEEPAVEAAPQLPPEEPVAEEPEPLRRRRFRWRRDRVVEEPGEPEPDDARPKHVRVLPAEAVARVEPLDPWEEELDVEPEAEHEATPRG